MVNSNVEVKVFPERIEILDYVGVEEKQTALALTLLCAVYFT